MPQPKLITPRPKLVRDAKSGIWMVSYTHPQKGYTVKKSTGQRDRTLAGQEMHAMVGNIIGIGPSGDDYSIDELLKAYEASKETLANAEKHALPRLIEFFGAFKPEQLVDSAWRRYRRWRTGHEHVNAAAQYHEVKRKVSDATACRELSMFRAAISWAKRNPKWKGLDHVRVVLPDAVQNARQEYLSKAEVRQLLAGCVELHQLLFVLLALATAGRHRALLDLKWTQVTWPAGEVPTVTDVNYKESISEVPRGPQLSVETATSAPTGHGTRYMTWTKKPKLTGAIHIDLGSNVGNKRKPIAVINPSNVRLYDALLSAYERKTTEYVIEWRGQKVDRIDLSDAYRRGGLPRPAAPQHVLKHTSISWMVQDGQELAKIAALTRTSVHTIERVYGHLSPKHIEVVGEVLTVE